MALIDNLLCLVIVCWAYHYQYVLHLLVYRGKVSLGIQTIGRLVVHRL
jgi:hypothetical protein